MPIDPAEMQRLSGAIRSVSIRKAFAVDPLAALQRAGVDTTKIPLEAIDALAELTPEELDVIARVDARLSDKLKAAAGDTNGYVVF